MAHSIVETNRMSYNRMVIPAFVQIRNGRNNVNNWTVIINFSIGVAGLFVSILGLIMSIISRPIEKTARWHLSGIFSIMAAYSVTNILSYQAELMAEADLMRWAIFLSSLLSSLLMPVLTSLMLHFSGERCRRSGLFLCIMLLMGIYSIMLVSTFFSPVFYSIDKEGTYLRGSLYPFLLVPPVLIMALNLWGLWVRRNALTTKQRIAFLVYLLVPMFSMLIQMIYYGILATALGAIIGSMALFLFVLSDQQDRFIRVTEENANREFGIRILQIRPHFIYNALTSIYYIVEENPTKAQRVIRDFSIYLRNVFYSITSQVPVPFIEELEHTKAYLSVEAARFEDQLSVIYDISHTNFQLPPLTLQPVVENAVKHGMDPELERLNIRIQTRSGGGYSEIIVENDGEDFIPPSEKEEGIGLSNTADRLKRMCGGELIVSKREGGGAVVTIRIPDPRSDSDSSDYSGKTEKNGDWR